MAVDKERDIANKISDLRLALKEAQWASVDARRDLMVLEILERSLTDEIAKLQQQIPDKPQF